MDNALIDYQNLARAFVESGNFNPEFMAVYYRALFPDLNALSDSELGAHYADYGRDEGRSASPADLRFIFLASIPSTASVLEIGPFTAPSIRGPNVKYFDVLDADGLRARAKANNYPIVEPVRVDFVSSNGDLGTVPYGFDVVYSAHCLEHTPDMIAHLLQVARILKRDGTYMLTIPDLRYTFDHFRAPSEIGQVIAAHNARRTLHAPSAVTEFYVLSTHNDPAAHWRGDHGPHPRIDIPEREALAEQELLKANGGYVDIHAWFFTPACFRSLMADLIRTETVPFTLERVYNTPYGQNEFNVVLRKT